ncbi:hypothetical protein RJ639_046468 [Escallonia herrerae]|uniref:Uncharacterized protein n=1 Tax=Escallonia herrerae TaxID=1293975 RepID=A0AA88W5R0_9ASTE|nr:hypothetical protein RJ639_046468 [Escallonia herrerae]
MQANRHTIILMQTSQNKATRTFMDYDSISKAMDELSFMNGFCCSVHAGICGLYERKLKDLNPATRNITYDIADLYNFIDGLADLSALVYFHLLSVAVCIFYKDLHEEMSTGYDHSLQAFLPYDRQWIKERTFQHLKKLAQYKATAGVSF